MSAAGVVGSTSSPHEESPGSNPRAALHRLLVKPIDIGVAKKLVKLYHYLHSLPGGTQLAFGVFVQQMLMGVITFGCGPSQVYRLVHGAIPENCAVLTRLWLSDELPTNSESKVIGYSLRALRKYTDIKFIVSYADPAQRHIGTIYQATNWIYTGLSQATPLYDLGDGVPRHSRTLSQIYGTHSLKHFRKHGTDVKLVPQAQKHRYVYFLDSSWREQLAVPEQPYPKKE